MNATFSNIKDIIADPQTRLWGGIVLVTILLTTGLFFLAPHNQNIPRTENADPSVLALKPGDWVRGDPKTAKAVLIEYSDFQCPACGMYYSILRQLETDLGKDIAVVYRSFPLSAIHPNAELAARAAEAAGAQGKFFEMHDQLFTEQKTWSNDTNAEAVFTGYAEKLGLNMEKFKADLNAQSTKDKIAANVQDGMTLGLRGTPSFFLNNKALPAARSGAEFKTSITSQIYKN